MPKRWSKIIAFEAQQNVPFPIDQVVWDYQLVGGGMDEQIQVVLVAIKRDLLDEINDAVEETGLQTRISIWRRWHSTMHFVTITPNSTAARCWWISARARPTSSSSRPDRIFSRSHSHRRAARSQRRLRRNLANPLPRRKPERTRDAFVALGGAAEPDDPDIGRVSKIVRSTMTRLHAELMRSITHYRAQQQGDRPSRIFLCGGGAGMPNMREFFHEKFELPVEFFNPLKM